MFKRIVFVTPWFGEFAGGAETLVRTMAVELRKRGIETIVLTTCSKSPYDNWWEDYYAEGTYHVYGIPTHRFATNKRGDAYKQVIKKIIEGNSLTEQEKYDFFVCGINSTNLTNSLKNHVTKDCEIIALPYFHGLTHSVINSYPGQISLVPCFHNEIQFYWENTKTLLSNAKHIFFNSIEEKELAITNYGSTIGRKLVESIVTGVGIELNEINSAKTTIELPKNYFVYMGRKEKGKNVHILCEWFERYRCQFLENTKLIFIGGGDSSLLPKSDAFIDFGVVSDTDKKTIIKKSKGLINLSENESFSIVIMEAWLLEISTIVSENCAVTTGHARRANGGLYVKNSDEFIQALHYLEKNADVASVLGKNGKQYVYDNFSFDIVLNKYLEEFQY